MYIDSITNINIFTEYDILMDLNETNYLPVIRIYSVSLLD